MKMYISKLQMPNSLLHIYLLNIKQLAINVRIQNCLFIVVQIIKKSKLELQNLLNDSEYKQKWLVIYMLL